MIQAVLGLTRMQLKTFVNIGVNFYASEAVRTTLVIIFMSFDPRNVTVRFSNNLEKRK